MTVLAASLLLWAASTLASSSSPAPPLGTCQPLANLTFAHAPAVAPGFKASVIYSNMSEPRGMRFDCNGNLLVIERYIGVTALTYRNDKNCVGWEKRTVIAKTDLEHGIEIGPGPGKGDNQYLYASSMESVWRWEYNPVNMSIVGPPITINYNMSNVNATPPDHVTRTLLLEPAVGGVSKYLIVSRGSAGNINDAAVDPNTGTAQIRRFSLDKIPPGNGYEWHKGQLLSYGNRNAVGLAFSKDGESIWDIENSSDEVTWRGVDVHQNNPADELNLIPLKNNEKIPLAQRFYGYPNCFTAWDSSNITTNATSPQFNFKTGEQFSIRAPPTQPTDKWCQNSTNNVPPRLSLQAHVAPLDIVFYKGATVSSNVGFKKDWVEDAFAGFHGSWNRDAPSGYSVVRIPFTKDGKGPVAKSDSKKGYENLVWMADTSGCPENCIRPVGVIFTPKGQLIVSSDDSGEVFMIESTKA